MSDLMTSDLMRAHVNMQHAASCSQLLPFTSRLKAPTASKYSIMSAQIHMLCNPAYML